MNIVWPLSTQYRKTMKAVSTIGTGREEGDMELMGLILFFPVTYR